MERDIDIVKVRPLEMVSSDCEERYSGVGMGRDARLVT